MKRILVTIVSIIRYSLFVYSLYRLTKNETEKNVNYVNECAKKCGPLAIKLLQIIVMGGHKKLIKSDKLDFVLEDCYVHPFQETERLYQKEYNKSIHDDYILNEESVVGSGSIGQVYKAFCKKRNEFIALKVKHPGIDKNVTDVANALKLVCFIFKSINKFHYPMLQYINNIHLQIDYIQEANNTVRLKQYFKDDHVIVIPEILDYNNNFIKMTYHEGKVYEKVSEQAQLVASMYITFFYLSGVLIYDFLHADLHFGNWKIIENCENDEHDVKLIIYDCGIMSSTGDLEINRELLHNTFNRRNFVKIMDIIAKMDPTNKRNKKLEYYKNEVNKLISFDMSASEALTIFLNKIIEIRVLRNKDVITFVNAIAIIGETPKKSIAVFTKNIYSENSSNAMLYYVYVGVLTRINLFNNLKDYFIQELEKSPDNKIQYENWLYEEFGHKNGKVLFDIIYDKFFPPKKTNLVI